MADLRLRIGEVAGHEEARVAAEACGEKGAVEGTEREHEELGLDAVDAGGVL
jgi:hypothetical protein